MGQCNSCTAVFFLRTENRTSLFENKKVKTNNRLISAIFTITMSNTVQTCKSTYQLSPFSQTGLSLEKCSTADHGCCSAAINAHVFHRYRPSGRVAAATRWQVEQHWPVLNCLGASALFVCVCKCVKCVKCVCVCVDDLESSRGGSAGSRRQRHQDKVNSS